MQTRIKNMISLLCLLLITYAILRVSTVKCESVDFLQDLKDSLNLAFEKVLEAERAGANVTALVARLNEAASLLLEANLLESNGKHNEAMEAADAAAKISEEVRDQASRLKASAISNRRTGC